MQSDRFARKITPILMLSVAARLRRLMRNSLGRTPDQQIKGAWNG